MANEASEVKSDITGLNNKPITYYDVIEPHVDINSYVFGLFTFVKII